MNSPSIPQLGLIDTSIVLFYLGILWFIAIRSARKEDKDENFLLAGRRLTIPAFVATLVTTWYGGILGVGEFGWKHGISTWLVFGIPYYIHAIIFALFLAPLARRGKYINLPDQLDRAYGRNTAIVGAALLFIMTVPAAYILMLGELIRLIIPLPLIAALVLGAAFSTAYLWHGGFRAVVRTDKLQFLLMFGGFFILLFFCLNHLSLSDLAIKLPSTHLTWHGGNRGAYIALWYIVAAQTYIEPSFYQRCYAAKSESTAKWGTMISVGVWLIFDIVTTLTALYSRVLIPELANPVNAYPSLAGLLLPVGLLGIFIAGLFATVMSTVDSYGFLAAMLLGRDIVSRAKGKISSGQSIRSVRLSLIVVAVLAILLAAWKGSVVDIWKELGSIGTPALLIPVLTSFWKKSCMTSRGALISMALAGGVAILWTLSNYLPGSTGYLLGIEPVYPGLVTSITVFLVDRFILRAGNQSEK